MFFFGKLSYFITNKLNIFIRKSTGKTHTFPENIITISSLSSPFQLDSPLGKLQFFSINWSIIRELIYICKELKNLLDNKGI